MSDNHSKKRRFLPMRPAPTGSRSSTPLPSRAQSIPSLGGVVAAKKL
ncbi:unnamed protein product [Rhizoctonia solani]|uniref:Uncharacterized protein n=1 Tax=Rhizoctonia solani TaxID=456999 RepID=A0A8H3CCK7_9AGAM|nr:unnamed protein product [Rhizoctonia solani]